MRRALALTLPLLPGLLGGWSPAISQSSPVTTFDDSLVVSASLEPEDRERTPASATVIPAEEIAARQATTLADALALVPGLAVVQAGASGQQASLFVRGAESDQTLLLWNGIVLNDPFFGGANWQFVPTDGAERIEVVRGPFSALYGSGALGGVVQLFTGGRDGGSLRLEGGEEGYARGSVVAGAQRGRGRLDAIGLVRRGGAELRNDDFAVDELTARGRFALRDDLEIGLVLRGDESETGIPLSGRTATLDRSISWREREVALPIDARFGAGFELSGQIAETRFDSAFRAPSDPFGFTRSDTESEGRRARAVASWEGDRQVRVSAGADWERLEVSDSSSFGVNLTGAHQRTWAAFGEVSAPLGRSRLEVGLRRDDNDVYGQATSLRAGAVVPVAGFLIRASYGEAFRAPSLGELFFPGSGNPDLEPEEGRSAELGVERRFGAVGVLVTAFENRQRNRIEFDPVTFRSANVARARSRGVEATIDARRGIVFGRLAATLLDSEDRSTGLTLLRRPRRSASLYLTVAPGEFLIALSGRYVGDRADLDPETFARATNPRHVRFDLSTRYAGFGRFAPYVRVENLADRSYEEALGFPAPGRTWIGGLGLSF